LALWVVGAAAAGCGRPAGVQPQALVEQLASQDHNRVQEALREIERQATADPEGLLPVLLAELERAGRSGGTVSARVRPDLSSVPQASRVDVAVDLTRLLRARLINAGFPVSHLKQSGDVIDVHLRPPLDARLVPKVRTLLLAELARTGGYELRAEVPPPFTPSPERPRSPWEGDLDSYTRWRETEQRLWDAAQASGSRYVPSRPDLALVPTVAGHEAQGAGLVALRIPPAEAPALGDRDMLVSLRDDPVLGTPAIYLVARPGREADVRRALEAAAGLTLWLVEGDRALLAARLPGKPGIALSFPVHGRDLPEARQRSTILAAQLSAGRLTLPVTVEPLEPPLGVDLSSPLCEALVRVGQPAEPSLRALAARDPVFAPLVERLVEEILRRRR
jgi:hypothetical protein